MGATALLKGITARGTSRLPRRRPARVAVLAWAVAFVAILGAGVSAFLQKPTAAAMVIASDGSAAPATPEALIDPTHYRKSAPPADGRPRIAIILRGLGISDRVTHDAIASLPGDVTLGFSPYGRDLQKTADAARQAGHEIFLDMPVEPSGFPANDAGPEALLTSISAAENADRLSWSMARFTGYAGIVVPASSPALETAATIGPILSAPAAQGLVWAHSGARGFDGARIEAVRIALAVDDVPKAEAINAALEQLEAKARADGSALAVALPYPVTLDVLKHWAASLDERGFTLVPASALAAKPVS